MLAPTPCSIFILYHATYLPNLLSYAVSSKNVARRSSLFHNGSVMMPRTDDFDYDDCAHLDACHEIRDDHKPN